MRTTILILCTLALASCGPNYNQISNRLREENMKQEREIGDLKEKLSASEVRINQLQGQLDQKLPRVETLPEARLAQLFTVAKIEIRNQTDSWEIEPHKGLTAFRVFLRTFAADDTIFPATGDVTIEAFELPPAPAQPLRLGTWKFTPGEMKKNWYGGFGLNQFALNCPWNQPPKTADILFKVSFQDALTGKLFEAHLNKKITLPK